MFAATKADHLHRSGHDRLEAILERMTERAIERAGFDHVRYEDRMLGNICIHFGVRR